MMATQSPFSAFKTVLKALYENSIKPAVTSFKYLRELLLALLALVVLGGGFLMYRSGVQKKEQKAQLALAGCLQEFMRLDAQPEKTIDDWLRVQTMCTLGYEDHTGTSLAPYFLLFKADAFMQQGDKQQAYSTMEQALNEMSSGDPLLTLYKIKFALMQLDADDIALVAQGVQDLKDLASDSNNANNDMAQYYIGAYYWAQNDTAQAREWFQKAVAGKAANASPWVAQAESKLAQLN